MPQHVRAGQDCHASFANVDRGIDVSVVFRAAFRALPFAHVQGHFLDGMAAIKAAFAAWIPAVNVDSYMERIAFLPVFFKRHKLHVLLTVQSANKSVRQRNNVVNSTPYITDLKGRGFTALTDKVNFPHYK